MKILVIGSTGPQGREFVAQALAAGHAVCAFARNPAALQPAPGANGDVGVARPRPHGARVILIDAVRKAHRWLDKLLSDPSETIEAIALREGKTDRSIRMTMSLAFLAPDIVKAAIDGRLPRGFGLKRLIDLPMAWPDQWRALGLRAPARS